MLDTVTVFADFEELIITIFDSERLRFTELLQNVRAVIISDIYEIFHCAGILQQFFQYYLYRTLSSLLMLHEKLHCAENVDFFWQIEMLKPNNQPSNFN